YAGRCELGHCHAWRSYLPRFWTTNGFTPGDAEQALAGGVDSEASQVAGNPAAVELFGHGGGGAGAAEAVEHEVAFVGGSPDDTIKKALGLLCGESEILFAVAGWSIEILQTSSTRRVVFSWY